MGDKSIELTPAKQADGSIQWTMDYEGKKGSSPGTYPAIDLPKDSGSHKLTYTIQNPEGMSINFDPSEVQLSSGKTILNALWIQENTKPTGPATSSQIKKVTLKSPTELQFKDENSGSPVTLVYQLNFVDAANPGAGVTALDPELKNGGGGTISLQDPIVIAAVIGAVLIAAILLRRFIRPVRSRTPHA